MVLLDFSVTPLGTGESVGQYVAKCVEIVAASGLDYRLQSAMGTTVEGDLDQVLDVLKRCVEAVAAQCSRVSVAAKIDYRKDHSGMIDAKVASVERRLGRTVKK